MGWSQVSNASELSWSTQSGEDVGEASVSTSLGSPAVEDTRARARSRSPRVAASSQTRGCPAPLATLSGTEWWSPIVLQSMEHERDKLPALSKPMHVESAFSGTLAEAWVFRAFSTVCNIPDGHGHGPSLSHHPAPAWFHSTGIVRYTVRICGPCLLSVKQLYHQHCTVVPRAVCFVYSHGFGKRRRLFKCI